VGVMRKTWRKWGELYYRIRSSQQDILKRQKITLACFPGRNNPPVLLGREMESQCDITAVLLKNQMLEGIEDACRKYEKLESENSFFIPIVPTDFEKVQLVFSKGNMLS
jgi:hypothetical protein